MTAERGPVQGLSVESARRLRDLMEGCVVSWVAFWTLTYPRRFPKEGWLVKRDLKAFLQWVRDQEEEELRYVWALEFQDRGAPHLMGVADRFLPKEDVAEAWYRIVGSGDELHLGAGTQVISAASVGDLSGYFLKSYMAKAAQKTVPDDFENPGRMWGSSRGLGAPLVEREVTPAAARKVKRVMRKALERRRRRALPHSRDRCATSRGMSFYGWGPAEAERLVEWAEAEVRRGR